MLRRLVKIANNLDILGMHREAEKLTDNLRKLKKYMPEDAETKEISRANLAHEVSTAIARSLKMKMDEVFPLTYKMVNFEKSKEENIDRIKNHFKSQRTAAFIIEPKMFEDDGEVEVDDDEEGDVDDGQGDGGQDQVPPHIRPVHRRVGVDGVGRGDAGGGQHVIRSGGVVTGGFGTEWP